MKRLKIAITIVILGLLSCDKNNDENQSKQFPNSFEENEINICNFDLINSQDNLPLKSGAAILQWPLWKPGQTIKIKFLDGNDTAEEKVKRLASGWTVYANLKFEYVSKEDYADIRIGFNLGKPGAWSELGMRSAYGDLNRQTMRLGPLTADEATIRRTVLHEFGHALGLIHEHTSPAAKISWDLPKVYKYYSDWSKEEVDQFVLKSTEQTNYSEYDPLSIMHYYIDPALTTDGIGLPEQTELSITDMISINKWYPFPIRSIIESGERIDFIPWTQAIKSPNGKFVLEFYNGTLSIHDLTNDTLIWKVGNRRYNKRCSCYLETNGNLVIRGKSSTIVGVPFVTTYTSNTSKFPGAKLHLRDDGSLILIYNEIIEWSSKSDNL